MGSKTKIEWCDASWNPVTGCLHGCEYCYARRIAERFGGYIHGINECMVLDQPQKSSKADKDGKYKTITEPYPYSFTPTLHRYRMEIPKKWARPRVIFVCSMADLFGEWVPDEWIEEVFKACWEAPQHIYLFLTKNPMRLFRLKYDGKLLEESNIWYGSSYTQNGMKYICDSKKGNWFLSIEPLLADLGTMQWEINRPSWVIIGAETGNRKNKVVPEKEWIDNIVDQCRKYNIPVFMKDSLIDIMGEDNMRREFPWDLPGWNE